MKLDSTDQELVKLLRMDGRLSYANLAESLGISDGSARRRVQRMIDDGAIGIVAVTDPARLGLANQTMLAITVEGSAQAVADGIGQLADVVYVVFTSGRHDLLAEIVCTSAAHELETIDRIRAVEGIHRVETIPYTQIVKQEFALGVGVRGDRQPVAIDPIDREIIKHLQTDGRMSFARLGQLVGLSDAGARQRVNRLTERGIITIVAITDPATIGLGFQGLVGINASGDSFVLAARLAERIDAIYVVVTAGRYDIIAELLCEDAVGFMQVVNEIRTMDGVAAVEASTFLRTAKQTYDWGVGE